MDQCTEQKLKTILAAPESKQLLELLQASSPEALQQAATAAKQGNHIEVKELLYHTLQNPNVSRLVNQLQNKLG